jgi:hypothetical protein
VHGVGSRLEMEFVSLGASVHQQRYEFGHCIVVPEN